jgi:predicted ATPase
LWIESLSLNNIRSFADATLSFSSGINVLVGPNNAGKSTILLPLLGLQEGLPTLKATDMRLGETQAIAKISFGDFEERYLPKGTRQVGFVRLHGAATFRLMAASSQGTDVDISKTRISCREPANFIYPFLSGRKAPELHGETHASVVNEVLPTFRNLVAKIDRVSSSGFLPTHDHYVRACDEILGFLVATAAAESGKEAVYTVHNMDSIPLDALGAGVMNALGLLVHLVMAKGKLFLIEEPENDLHPKALRALLDIIIEKSADNQFIITTHSNIVLRRLGARAESKTFRIDSHFVDRMPTSTVKEIGGCPDARRELLSDLGYEFHDMDMWEGWLFLEESSAETIIREYLIPWFASELHTKLRTFSARCISEIEPKFRNFSDLYVFLHLTPAYKDRAWVLVDGGDEEKREIEKLVSRYESSGRNPSHFRQLEKHDFEDYYPARFADRMAEIKSLDKQAKREAKCELLGDVEQAIADDRDEMKAAFEKSAAEVIGILKEIEASLT